MYVIPFTYLNKFISEFYTFTEKVVKTYVNNLNFNYLSINRNINLRYTLIKQFNEVGQRRAKLNFVLENI